MGNSRFISKRLSFVTDGGAGGGTAGAADAGGAGADASAPAGGAGGDAGTGAQAAAQGVQTQGDQQDTQGEEISNLPKWAQDHIASLRQEAAQRRVAAQDAAEKARAEVAQTIGKALGVIPDEAEKVDPAALTATIAQREAELAAAQRALAVHTVASTLGANAVALLDSRSFEQSISQIDPTDHKALAAEIQKAIEKDARFKVTQAVPKSGGDLAGGSGEQRQTKPTTLDAAISGYYGK